MGLSHFSLKTKIAGLSGVLLLLMAATMGLYVGEIGRDGEVIRAQMGLVDKQTALVAHQFDLVERQSSEGGVQGALIDQQSGLVTEQLAAAQRQHALMGAQAEALGFQQLVAGMLHTFGHMRYWLVDYALSWRAESVLSAEQTRDKLDQQFEALVSLGVTDALRVRALAERVQTYHELMLDSINAYLADDRDQGTRWLVGSRAHGEAIEGEFEVLLAEADEAVAAAGLKTVDAATRLMHAAHQLTSTAAAMKAAGARARTLGEKVKLSGAQVLKTGNTMRAAGRRALEDRRRTNRVTLALMIVAVLLGVVSSWLFFRAIFRPLRRLGHAMRAIAEGRKDLSHRIEVYGGDEIARLASAFNHMLGALRETTVSTGYMNEIVESMTDALVVIDSRGIISKANRSMLRLVDYQEADLVGRPIKQVLGDPWIQFRITENMAGSDLVRGVESTYVRADGTEIPVAMSVAALRDNDTATQGFVCVARDIRERKRAEAVLRENEARFRSFAEAASDWYWEMDEQLRFSHFSSRFTEVTGVVPGHLLGRTQAQARIPGVDEDVWRRHLEALEAHRPFRHFVYPCTKPDGALVYVSISGAPIIDSEGNFKGYRGTGADVTALEQAKLELIRAKEASDLAARSRSEFLANMSHEIRTPMNGVLGMLDLLAGTRLEAEQRDYVDVAARSGEVLLGLINDILDLSKFEAGKLALESIDFDLRAAIEDVVELLAERAQAKELEIACTFSAVFPECVCGDPTRVRQVLTNLVSNAVKFTETGEVVVRLSSRPGDDGGHLVRFEVCDTGIGIPEAGQARIFDSFTQADGSTTRKYGGSGLGLTISRQLVEAMGGRIGVESTPGEGSRFWFEAPLATATQPGSEFAPADELQGLRILVAERHAASRQAIEQELQGWGIIVQCVAEEQALWSDLHQGVGAGQPFDAALIDVRMTQALASRGGEKCGPGDDVPLAATSLVWLTALCGECAEHLDALTPEDDTLTKPVRRSRLHACMARLRGLDDNAAQETASGTPAAVGAPRSERQPHVLVVEDNRVNQKVTLGLLATLDCRATVAEDGLQALRCLERERFDLILMDCQMPVLDGYEATRRIRASHGSERSIPIIALTANAMEGDAEKCRNAGMDDYLAKPIKAQALRVAIDRWVARISHHPAAAAADPPADADSAAVIDAGVFDGLRDALGADVADILEVYLEDTPANIEALRAAVQRGDADTVARVTHTLKGSSGNLGAKGLTALCLELEAGARARQLDGAVERVAAIAGEFERVAAALKRLCSESQTA